mmetsp:Transcript_30588/g.30036  ORF Transcript_30588/g.30036 Transcript_30588/m.30036 type:complete len:118 (+) Transcript_30588:1412-1765(+)
MPSIGDEEGKIDFEHPPSIFVFQDKAKDEDYYVEEELDAQKDPILKLVPLSIAEDQFEVFMTEYYKKLAPQMEHSTYGVSGLLQKQNFGYERHYLKLVDEENGNLEGMTIFNIDHTD